VRDAASIPGAIVMPCDLTDLAQARAAVERLPALDVLVYCAGANRPEPFADVSAETFDALFALNVRAAYFTAQAAARRMLREGTAGAIVLLSSQMGHVGAPERTVYCATKHAVEGMVKAMAVELAPHGIRVVSVAPTFVRTAMTAAQLDDPGVGGALRAQIPLGRWATPEEVADAVLWAASPRAGMLTGTSLVLDGGWTAR
jgi:NAD(P)-dependent dehydrogenase (short-subunit alcohol dehydrogenase family)